MSIGTAVTLTIEPRASGMVEIGIEVSRNLNRSQPSQIVQPFRVSASKLDDLAQRFKQELSNLQDSFGETLRGATPEHAGSVLQDLHIAGNNVLSDLLGRDEARRFQTILGVALSMATLSRPMLLELKSHQDYTFPLDLIPVTAPRHASLPSTKAELQTLAESFPVFSCVVRRTLLEASASLGQGSTLHGAPEPTVALFWNEMAPASGKDRTYFETLAARNIIRLNGPVPDASFAAPSRQSVEDLAMQLIELPKFVYPNGTGEIPYQLVHVSAHSRSGLPGVIGSTLLVLGKTTKDSRFSRRKEHVYSIQSGRLSYLADTMPVAMSDGPVGILSSCYSTTWGDKGMLGMVAPLLHAGYRCVAGFDAAISGIVAHQLFASAYDLLFSGVALGEALGRARNLMLLECYNPMGMLLRTYGQVNLMFGGG